MRTINKFLVALMIVSVPLTFTSCSDNYDYYVDETDLVSEAVDNYWYVYRGGADYYTTYNWFYYYYPQASDAQFIAFMRAVGYGGTPYWDEYNNGGYGWDNTYDNEVTTQEALLLSEAQTLCGEWEGPMVYEYTDDKSKQRIRETFTSNMKFFQYNSSANSLSGNGVEVDTADDGASQTLDFSWYVDKHGDIYIKYTKSGTIFVMDADSKTNGFHLGYEDQKGFDTFFGVAISTNTQDVFYIDLARQATNAKGVMAKTRALSGKLAGKSFGQATKNVAAQYKETAIKKLREK